MFFDGARKQFIEELKKQGFKKDGDTWTIDSFNLAGDPIVAGVDFNEENPQGTPGRFFVVRADKVKVYDEEAFAECTNLLFIDESYKQIFSDSKKEENPKEHPEKALEKPETPPQGPERGVVGARNQETRIIPATSQEYRVPRSLEEERREQRLNAARASILNQLSECIQEREEEKQRLSVDYNRSVSCINRERDVLREEQGVRRRRKQEELEDLERVFREENELKDREVSERIAAETLGFDRRRLELEREIQGLRLREETALEVVKMVCEALKNVG